MNREMPDLLPSRLNFDAVIFCGCTMKELQIIAVTSLVSCILVFGLLMKWFIGMFLVGVGISFPLSVCVAWFIAVCFQKAKQGKPKGYVKQALLIRLDELGLHKAPFIRRSGHWSVGRRIR